MFSGYRLDELRTHALGPAVLAHLDVLIDGRYQASDRLGDGLRGSANQQIHTLTARHTLAEVSATPHAEIQIRADGTIALTGVAPLTIRALR
jgi:anaerobic ribonucleoside-triphosphate reductase activating protein